MFRLVSIVLAVVGFHYGNASSLRSEAVLAECRSNYNRELSNDFLLGEWFQVSEYGLFGGFVPSSSCPSQLIYKASPENLTVYENAYNVKISMDDNPVLVDRDNGWALNVVAGNTEAKDWFSQPVTPSVTVNAYKKLSDDFMLVLNCALRGHIMWLHSRIRHPTNEEIAEVTNGVSEVSRLVSTRYCWPN